MRRRTFLTLGTEGIKTSKATACDVCLYNKSTQKLLIVKSTDFNLTSYPSSNYSPVGVVVVPGSHNVYGDGSCAVMSLNEMSYETPDTGSINHEDIFFGQYGVDVSGITNYNKVCYVGNSGKVNQTVQGVTDNAFMSTDRANNVQNPYDTDTYYCYNDTNYYIPSPYNDDDTRNPAYYQTSSPSSTSNCLSDFDGVGNTTKLINLATAQSDWKTASLINHGSGYNGYSPAACCCWRYHTEGTKQGDWYLPACGELGYIMPKFNKIQQTISTLTTAYGSTIGFQLTESYYYWSSSEYSNTMARTLTIHNARIRGLTKNDWNGYVRAFLRVK